MTHVVTPAERTGIHVTQIRSHEPSGPLPVGTPAPTFTLPQSFRQSYTLNPNHGRAVILAFYTLDWEPVSREQLGLYQDYEVEFNRLGTSLLAISVDHIWSHIAFAQSLRIRYPLLSDARPRGAVARQYGVYREDAERCNRALFLIGADGIIRFRERYPDDMNPGVNDILTAVEGVTSAENERRRFRRDGNGDPDGA